ncbi:MFS transporter [Halobacterium wangiae]|uniref:MFS transporter n=1 Tax=Halobacterium wangiae TaxID=2902623 RepID=UPI001E3458A9|nr:MFS transporter [Halobacterium wangiae]
MRWNRRPDVYAGWVVVTGCFLGSFVVFGLSYSFGVFFEPVLEAFGAPRSTTSTAFGVQTVALYVGAVGIGALVDRYGTRRMLAAGTVVLCGGLVATSRASTLPQFVAGYGVVTGAGLSVVYVVAYATPARWFDRRVGLASGLASAGLGFGMLVVSPVATELVARVGWRDALVALAAGVAVVLAAATALVRGEPGAGEAPAAEFPNGVERAGDSAWRDQLSEVGAVARTPTFALTFVGWAAIYGTLYVVLVNLVVYGTDLGMTRETGATALAVLGAASAAGRVAIGFFGDRLGRIRVFVACSAAMGVSTVALAGVGTPLELWAFAAVYGLTYGGNGALLAPLTADLFGRANINAVFGLISVAFAFSGILAPYLAGVGYEAFATYDPVFVAAGALAVVGAVAVAAADRVSTAG